MKSVETVSAEINNLQPQLDAAEDKAGSLAQLDEAGMVIKTAAFEAAYEDWAILARRMGILQEEKLVCIRNTPRLKKYLTIHEFCTLGK